MGVHATINLDDGYLGSGSLLKRAIKKYGKSSFEKIILEYFGSSEQMFAREFEVVNRQFIDREDTYNLTEGGRGFCSSSAKRAVSNVTKFVQSDDNIKKRLAYVRSEEHKEFCRKQVPIASLASQTPEAREKRMDTLARIKHQQGEKNSQFGTMWITNGKENRKIQKGENIPERWKKGRVMKK